MPPIKGYTFGMRLKDNFPKPSSTPGPLDYSTSCLTRFGKLSSPAYTIKSKGNTKDHRSTTPSPLDYQSFNLSKLKPTKSYSFGFGNRTAFTVKSDTPPPNKYLVPTTIGNNVPDKKKTGRAFSMQGRRKLNIEKSTTPGPGAYDTVSIDVYKKKEPAVPFTGHRQSPFLPADPHIPGPKNIDQGGQQCTHSNGTAFKVRSVRKTSKMAHKPAEDLFQLLPPRAKPVQIVDIKKSS